MFGTYEALSLRRRRQNWNFEPYVERKVNPPFAILHSQLQAKLNEMTSPQSGLLG